MACRRITLLALVAGFSASSAFSFVEPDADLLRGPSARQGDRPASLVERNLDGSMRPVDLPPPEAALELLTLDEPTRASVDRLLAERAAAFDAIVKANMETLNTLGNDAQAGGPETRREHTRTLMEMFKPVLEKGPLEEQIAAVLPEATRDQYRALLAEHREARLAEMRARGPRGDRRGPGGPPDEDPMLFEGEMTPPPAGQAGPRGDRPQRAGARLGQVEELRIEIRRSVERVTGQRSDRLEKIVAELGLDAEQEAKVRAIFRESAQNAGNTDDPRAARQAMMQKLAEVLTPEQRAKLREVMGGPARRGDAGPARRRQAAPKTDD